jgi:hypothetical protein
MSLIRRMVFAAPFVIACKKPVAKPNQVELAEPHDAAVVAERHDAEVVQFRILDISVQANDLVVRLDGGSANGVTRDWTGCVVKNASSDTCALGGDVVIINVAKHTTTIKTHVADEVLQRSRTVRLAPR